MNKIQNFISDSVTKFSPYSLNDEDNKIIANTSLADWVTSRLTSGKFRKAPLIPQTRQDIKEKVARSIEKGEPIYLIICFGGYKHYWNASYPEVDWAELFNLRFMSDYVTPILSAYTPGVILEYEAEDYILPTMNNYPEDRSNAYAASFQRLVAILKKYMPKNFTIRYIRAKDQYDISYVFDKLETRVAEKIILFKKLPKAKQEYFLHRTEQNVMWNGKKDLRSLKDRERRDYIRKSRCTDEAFLELDFEVRKNYFVGDNHISLVVSWGASSDNIGHWLTVGSTYSSLVDFWIGRGILEDRGTKIVPRIVSHTQYDSIKDKLANVPMKGIQLVNFKSIEVYKGEIEFQKQAKLYD
ncbi:hypothetical protein A2Z00_01155 [Candidatus Gottesmanbacteria bacterium RBG_13_45_10]|uniref:Uncharacterized protein n=1 Tax=Candidatus Gottesmanbacteria bacterium RBG_13_45_10 TaxID=1798370 RepID=A0A1F5ZH26_9BACT|nr:MAG: hypothetical protein A2Z00_01155 [Candidatus Gottesmanbacteria bacterium RBG_13_45_10]